MSNHTSIYTFTKEDQALLVDYCSDSFLNPVGVINQKISDFVSLAPYQALAVHIGTSAIDGITDITLVLSDADYDLFIESSDTDQACLEKFFDYSNLHPAITFVNDVVLMVKPDYMVEQLDNDYDDDDYEALASDIWHHINHRVVSESMDKDETVD